MEVGEEAAADDVSLPEFFKVYITLHSSQKLLIPREFVNYLNKTKSGQAKLAGPSGKTWRVELVKEHENVYFTDGWQVFINDNMVRDGDFLFFKLHGNLMFSVTIFDNSMCEKLVLFADMCSEGTDKAVKRSIVEHSQPKGSLFYYKEEDQSASVNPSFEKCISAWSSNLKHGCYLTFPSSFVQEHSLTYKSHEKMILQTCGNSTWEVTVMNSSGAIILRKGWYAFTRDNNIRTGDVCKFELLNRLQMLVLVEHRQEGTKLKKEMLAASNLTIGEERTDSHVNLITEEQTVPPTTVPPFANSIFVTRMKKYNVDRAWLVRIPSWFVQENALHYERKEKMVLRTETDGSWPVNVIQNYQSCFFCGGWAAFVHDNNIKEGDTCKFELVNRLEMKVSITHLSQQG